MGKLTQKFESFLFIQQVILKWLSFVYLSAFASLFYQIPALFGRDGLLPIYAYLKRVEKNFGHSKKMEILPNIFWYSPTLNEYLIKMFPMLQRYDEYENIYHVVCLLGVLISLGILLEKKTKYINNCFFFFILWFFYLSIFNTGQVFLSFQWDIMLLEVGFLAIFFSAIFKYSNEYEDDLSVSIRQLLKWLAFRLYFSSGVLKLLSECPTWWNLTALNYHFQSQCLPHVFSWQAHHLPDWIKRFMVAGNFVTLIFMPIFFFFPYRPLRITAGFLQVIMQCFIMWTGNYNFFNILSITVTLAVFDDQFVMNFFTEGMCKFFGVQFPESEIEIPEKINKNEPIKKNRKYLNISIIIGLFALIFYFYFPIETWWNGKRLPFDTNHVKKLTFYGVTFGAVAFLAESIYKFIVYGIKNQNYSKKNNGFIRGLKRAFAYFFFAVIFLASMYPFSQSLNVNLNKYINIRYFKSPYEILSKFQIVNQYGLFRRMTGVPKRPELIIEGSEDGKVWKEYDFQFKPGDTLGTPRFAFTHQPRLDWQMWFAALGDNVNQEPWLIILLDKFFRNSPSVMSLIRTNPFRLTRPPNYLRIDKYDYYFTDQEEHDRVKTFWRRDKNETYLGSIKKNDPIFHKILKEYGIEEIDSRKYGLNVMQYIPLFEGLFTFIMLYFLKYFMF